MLVASCVSLWLFYIFGTRQGMFKYIRCFKNEKYTSWNCPLLWPWGAARGSWLSLTQASGRAGERAEWRGSAGRGSQLVGCQERLWCGLWGTWPRCLPREQWFMSWDDEEREWRVPSWSWGWGSGAGMWQEGGNSCLPRAWVSIKQVFSSGQGPVLVPPAVARGCPWRWAGPKENSQQRKGPLWRAEDGCWTRGRLPELCGQGGGRQVLPPGHPCPLEKECTTWKLQIQFYSGVLLRTIAWETASASSEELLQRDKGGAKKKLWSNVRSSQRTDISS